ncbi:MAG: metal-dependent hydrolase [Sphingomonadaceae bacterium]|nr:metal-dependent hydrolase [Sphingomonadaceae bacterium]
MRADYLGGMDATQTTVPTDARPSIVSRNFRAATGAVTERHWVRQDPYASAFFNALSAVFPHGETFMIRSLVPWVGRVPDALRPDVQAFIEQEADHSREHVAMNRALTDMGYDIEPLDRKIRAFVSFFAGASDTVKLTATMCIEHFTAIIAAELLKNRHHLEGVDDDMLELWLWHAVEEVEHKGVAYDVWDHATNGWNPLRRYAWRSFFMLAVTTSFFINRTLGQIELLRQDGHAFLWSLKQIMRAGFGRGGIGRNVLAPWAAFFRPNYHPWDKDDRLLLAQGEADLATIAARRAGYATTPSIVATALQAAA